MSTAMGGQLHQGHAGGPEDHEPSAVAYAVARDQARRFPPVHLCYTTAWEPAPPASYTYVTAANGLFLRVESPFFGAILPLVRYPVAAVRGLDSLTPCITLHVPRVPVSLLATMAGEALHTAATAGREALWQVQWLSRDGAAVSTGGRVAAGDNSGGGWRLVRPVQATSPGQVRYDATAPDVLLTVHSHGRGGATYFSATDDADDTGLSFQGVIGDLCRPDRPPHLLLRLCAFGYRWPVPPQVIFARSRVPASLAALPPLYGTVAETGWAQATELAVDLVQVLSGSADRGVAGRGWGTARAHEREEDPTGEAPEPWSDRLLQGQGQALSLGAEPPSLELARAERSQAAPDPRRPAGEGSVPAAGRGRVLPQLRHPGQLVEWLMRHGREESGHER